MNMNNRTAMKRAIKYLWIFCAVAFWNVETVMADGQESPIPSQACEKMGLTLPGDENSDAIFAVDPHARDESHDDTKNFPAIWKQVQPYAVAANVTGLHWEDKYVHPSQGDSELATMRTIQEGGWNGSVGLVAEKGGDAEVTLQNYMRGLDWLAAELKQPGSGGPAPFPSVPEADQQKNKEPNPFVPGLAVFKKHCAVCHESTTSGAPSSVLLHVSQTPHSIYAALTTGPMRGQTAPLSDQERRDVAKYLTDSRLSDAPSRPLVLENPPTEKKPEGNITADRLLNGGNEPGAWLTGGRDWQQSYFSPLTNINKENIKKLGFAWQYNIAFDTGFQATPVVVDGVMFTSGNHGKVYAIDARTGALRWSFEPKFDTAILRVQCCDGVNRGVSVWHGKVYVAAVDGMLYALNAVNGEVVWKTDTIMDHRRSYTSTGAPYIANNVVVIGNSGGEYDARGYITAYNVESGKFAWRFFTVPGDPKKGFEHPELEMAAKTWDPNTPWEIGLGGTVWDGMAYDPNLNLLYFGTGNGLPWNRKLRGPVAGDHLFLACILAVNPDNGRLAWYYQTTPGDNWDYDATQKFVLADLKIGGKSRSVIMQATKNGFFYVLDRATGKLLSATPFAYTNWASRVDIKSGRPIETGKADYSKGPKLVFPTQQGAHNWNPMSYNPGTGLVYIPVLEQGEVWGAAEYTNRRGQWNIGATIVDPYPGPSGLDSLKAKEWPSLAELSAGDPDPSPRIFLRAWDPVEQKLVWQVDATEGSNKPAYGTSYGARHLAGVMSTSTGLVFQGHIDGHLRVFDATTGAVLHSIDVGTSMTAAPMTYSVDGEQYVAIMAGTNAKEPAYADYKYGNKGRIVAFKLGGGAVPQRPLIENYQKGLQPPVNDLAKPEDAAAGGQLFAQHCAVCHSVAGRAPDLTRMTAQTHQDFLTIVLQGSRASKGMGNFSAILTQNQAEAIHAYVIHLSWEKYRYELEHEKQEMAAPKN